MPPSGARGVFRRLSEGYSRLLSALLSLSVAILVVPVTLQIVSRYTDLIPSWIWTEEMARFFLVWMIMIGSMVGVREGMHFTVDLWPALTGRRRAAFDVFAGCFVLLFAFVFVWWGWEFTEFAWFRISELAELPLWLIHMAWPITGVTWLIFAGERMADSLRILTGQERDA